MLAITVIIFIILIIDGIHVSFFLTLGQCGRSLLPPYLTGQIGLGIISKQLRLLWNDLFCHLYLRRIISMLDSPIILLKILCESELGQLPVTETQNNNGSNRILVLSRIRGSRGRQSKIGMASSSH